MSNKESLNQLPEKTPMIHAFIDKPVALIWISRSGSVKCTQIIRFEESKSNYDQLVRDVSGALRSTIDAHGPITKESIGSAAKRIVGLVWRKDE